MREVLWIVIESQNRVSGYAPHGSQVIREGEEPSIKGCSIVFPSQNNWELGQLNSVPPRLDHAPAAWQGDL